MTDNTAISLTNVSKVFKRYHHPVDRLKELLLPGKQRAEEFWALRDVDLEIPKGETIGIIGRNGAGKSTLLQIIAGTLQPTTGDVIVNGRVSALLELGSGFNPEFTGRQNVFFNGRILGLTQAEVESRFDVIAAFADIGKFIDQPTKTYSSGMLVRLAFSVAIHVDPEVLIVDEALAVGDGIFIHRCMRKIEKFQDSGGTILFVSHDTGSVCRLCSEVVWINDGLIQAMGKPFDISKSYQGWVYDQINAAQRTTLNGDTQPDETLENATLGLSRAIPTGEQLPTLESLKKTKTGSTNPCTQKPFINFNGADRFGTGRAEIIDFKATDADGQSIGFIYPQEQIILSVKVVTHELVEQPLIGIMLYDRLRTAISGFNTYEQRQDIPPLLPGDVLTVQFSLVWPAIQGGSYAFEPAIASGSQDSHEMLDWLYSSLSIKSGATDLTFGLLKIVEIEVSHNINKSQLAGTLEKIVFAKHP